jgi:dienelactone hydrolase/pimeloyl-ACP methyl ester carboxylesterase
MRFSFAVLLLSTAATTSAQEKLQVLPPDTEPRKMLYSFLQAEARAHFDARRKLVAALKTPEQIRFRQDELRAKFLDAIGPFPDKTPLNARVTGTLKGVGFRVEKVVYESRPQHHVTANLYIPDGKGPFPGVLVPCGHSDNGKAAEAYQRVCILMAQNGLAVLCYDPIGQGERLQLLDDKLKPGIKGSTTEHTQVGIGALLVGSCCANYRIWDGIRSIDYLVSRPEIDAKKIGCTGNSGGGTMTAYLMALDDRIACAAPSCYLTTLQRLFATLGPQDAEQNIPGQVAFGMDHADYLTLRAPRPTLMCVATRDFFDIDGAWTTFREASLIYSKLGHGERVALFEFDDKHGFSKPRREAAMRWMRRWLLRIDDAPVEKNGAVFTDAELQCTRSGQVLEDFKGVSCFHLNAKAADALAAERAKFPQRPEAERLKEIRRLLGLPAKVAPAKLVRQKIHYLEDRLSTHKVIFETEPGVLIPGLRFKHVQPKGPLVLYLPDRGLPQDGKLPKELEGIYAKNHQEVLIVDLRGLGETSPTPMPAKMPYFGVDFKESFLAMHLNRPLPGQRVLDVLAILGAAGRDEAHVYGFGVTGPVALHAAAVEPSIKQVTLERSLVSWSNVTHTPASVNQLSNVVPGVLKVYDLPELAATLSPRTLTIRGSIDAGLRPVTQAELDLTYRDCRDAYAKRDAGKRLNLQATRSD